MVKLMKALGLKTDDLIRASDPQAVEAINAKLSRKGGKPTEQDVFQEIARLNAAMPVQQGGLGMGVRNTAQERARGLGFDTPVYHGSSSPNIKGFDTSLAGKKTGNAFDNYVFSTAEPKNASGYSLNWDSFKKAYQSNPETLAEEVIRSANNRAIADAFQRGDKAEVERIKAGIPNAYARYEKMYEDFKNYKVPSEGATVYPMMTRSEEFYPFNAEGKLWSQVNRSAIDNSKAWNYPGVKIKNVRDNAGEYSATSDVYATNKPALFRSRFAAFDPARVNENNLLASRLLPFALPGLLALPTDEE
jgi:hypothetical protein